MGMGDINFEDLNYEEIGIWPLQLRIGVVIIAIAATIGLSYNFLIKTEVKALKSNSRRVDKLKRDFEDIYRKTPPVSEYKDQIEEMAKRLEKLILLLPTENHVPDLIKDISYQAQNTNLESKSISIKDEVDTNFYVEIPLDIKMSGEYHDIGRFISNVAKLPRIVTFHDFSIKKESKDYGGSTSTSNSNDPNKNTLHFRVIAKAYRYHGEKDL